MSRIDLVGRTFGRLKVLKFVGSDKNRQGIWSCQCLCGIIVPRLGCNLNNGSTNSCGCYRRETAAAKLPHTTEHGHRSRSRWRNGRSPEYSSWDNMKSRCTNVNATSFNAYGDAGIKVCERWLVFDNFLADMGPRPEGATLGRILDMGNYEPGNVFWMTWAEQGLARKNKHALLRWAATSLGDIQWIA